MKESDWTRDFCTKLTACGAIVVANVMGRMQNHVPDRTIVCTGGCFLVEFKGLTTKWSDGQRILAERMNSRYPCSFVYRYPGVLSIGDLRCEVTDPRQFLEMLAEMRNQLIHRTSQFI